MEYYPFPYFTHAAIAFSLASIHIIFHIFFLLYMKMGIIANGDGGFLKIPRPHLIISSPADRIMKSGCPEGSASLYP